jgi:hypothetical protein
MRTNHKGVKMDAEQYPTNDLGDVAEVTKHARQIRSEGMGLIGMKLAGESQFTDREDRKAAMKYAFQQAGVQCVTVGFKSPAEIDEAIENLNLALKA